MIEPLKTLGSTYQPEKPPADTADQVGFGNAIDEIGRAMFGSGWREGKTGQQQEQVIAKVASGLQAGELVATYLFGSAFSAISPDKWAQSEREWIRRARIRPYGGPSEAWLFVTRKSLASFKRANWPPKSSRPFLYSMSDRRWRLFDAVIWVATGGAETTTAAIAEGDLDEKGARILFDRLDQLGAFHGPVVTGLLPRIMQRTPVHLSWERAHTGWLGNNGHRVMFYEGPEGHTEADIIPFGQTEPSYVDVRIDREDLLQLFPASSQAAAATRSAGGPRPKEARLDQDRARALFREIIEANPHERTHNRADMERLAVDKLGGANLGRNALRRARREALDELEARGIDVSAWREGTRASN
jgi:hypothetical protein